MGPTQFGRAASLQNHRVDQVSRSAHPATSISISKVSSMSCDIRPLCGELTHLPSRHCPVSGHTGHLLQDIVDRPAAAEGLIAAAGVEGELSEQGAVGGDDADIGAGDE